MRCNGCDGKGCDDCGDTGEILITQCPLDFITDDVWRVIEMAGFFEKGIPPVSGGVLDQAQSFLDAAAFIFSESSYWKNKLGILN